MKLIRKDFVFYLIDTMFFGFLFVVFVSSIIALLLFCLSLLPDLKLELDKSFILSMLGLAFFGFTGITLLRHHKETLQVDVQSKYCRFHEAIIASDLCIDFDKIRVFLAELNYKDITLKSINSESMIVEAILPEQWRNLPIEAGGNKNYPEVKLILRINNERREVLIRLGPSKWHTPTMTSFSNAYFLKELISAFAKIFFRK